MNDNIAFNWGCANLQFYILVNHTKQDKFFLFYFKVKIYSRVHISSDTAFLKILKKPSIVQEYMLPHMNLLGFLHTEKPKKKFFWSTQ